MRILADQPDLARDLRSEPDGVPNFVEECLRLESPIKCTHRVALVDLEVGGVEVPAGSVVVGLFACANRDPRIFEDPDRFDAGRTTARRNIAFGHGEHFCPGASLARTEANISFERLLSRLDAIELAEPDRVRLLPSSIIRGVGDLPLRFRSHS